MDASPQPEPRPLLRLLILLGVAAIVGLGVWLALFAGQPRWVAYSDGSLVRVVDVYGGAHRPPPLVGKPWSTLVQRLPVGPKSDRLRSFVGGTPNGESRSWTHVPDEANGLHLWWEMKVLPLASGNYQGGISDAEGWIWISHGQGNALTTVFGDDRQLFGVDFAAFPRWQQSLEVAVATGTRLDGQFVFSPIGQHRIKNPMYSPGATTNWLVRGLPQTVRQDKLEVTLESLTFKEHSRMPSTNRLEGQIPPAVRSKIVAIEQPGPDAVTGAWHQVQAAYFDNFGNSSLQGLPPRRPSAGSVPAIQWRVAVKLVGDHRSTIASNAFAALTAGPLPAPGKHTQVATSGASLGGLAITAVSLVGPGSVQIVDGVIATNLPPRGGEGPGVSESSSAQTDSQGKVVETLTLSFASPVVVASLSGSTNGIWFSCRAENPRTGEVRWLQTYGSSVAEPAFQRVFNNRGQIWFTCEQLAPDEAWRITVGIHQPREVEFFIDRPEYVKSE